MSQRDVNEGIRGGQKQKQNESSRVPGAQRAASSE